jgi:succinyl-CoA synthetase beta subunit
MEHEVFPLLEPTGLAAPPFVLLRPGDSVPAAMQSWSPPFIAKIVSQTIIHRRSAGGVAMNLGTVAEAHRAAAAMFQKFGDQISAVLIEPMLKPDLELILGAKQSPMGVAIMLGFGGTFVEDFGAVALRLSPLEARDATALLEESRARAAVERLAGARAEEAIGKLVDIVRRFDALCRGIGADLQEFDINPIGFYSDTLTFRALDAKIVLAETHGSQS